MISCRCSVFCFCKQKTAYEMRISDWSSDVCSSDLLIWLMFAINLLGPKPVAKFQSLCVALGLAPVALVLVFGWSSFDRGLYEAAWNVTGDSDAKEIGRASCRERVCQYV